MPTLGNIIDAVDLLKVDPISIDSDRCVVARNRNSRCRRCVEACFADAISARGNSVSVDGASCVNCGACASACPTTAISMVSPAREQVDKRLERTSDRRTGMAVIVCSRRAAKEDGDPGRYAEVPCLAHVSDYQLVSLVSSGLDDVLLVDGDCGTCKLGGASACVDDTVSSAASILEAVGSDAVITRCSELPEEVVLPPEERSRGRSRRGLARQTGEYMRSVAGNVARRTLEERLSLGQAGRGSKGAIGWTGKLPKFAPDENYALIDDMERIRDSADDAMTDPVQERPSDGFADDHADGHAGGNAHAGASFDSRRFGEVSIAASECSGCGICVVNCPTKALAFDEYGDPDDPERQLLEFSASDCLQCMLCRDVCLKRCLEVSSRVTVGSVCDPAPRSIEVPKSHSAFAARLRG